MEKDEIISAFKLFDLDKSGKITFENLKQIAQDLNRSCTDDEILAMLKEIAKKDG